MSTRLKLICIPYSGSSSTIFKEWGQWVGPEIEITRFDYPGRGSRAREAASRNLSELISRVVDVVKGIDGPYAFFGHSMGAAVSYLASVKIESMGLRKPVHVFHSGFEPPHVYFARKSQAHKLNDEAFIASLKELGSMPSQLLNDPRAIRLYLPSIRHDFFLLETYDFSDDDPGLSCPVSIFVGKDDPLTNSTARSEWDKCSKDGCRIFEFDGGHFFVESAAIEVASSVRKILAENVGTG